VKCQPVQLGCGLRPSSGTLEVTETVKKCVSDTLQLH